MQQQPAELFQEYTTIEYNLPTPAKQIQPPAYVFVVDTCVAEDELRACVASLSQALTTLPEYAQVRLPQGHVSIKSVRARQGGGSEGFEGARHAAQVRAGAAASGGVHIWSLRA